ncbi:DUF6278 family protein [Streptomyces zagrosensis]|uniref:Uncharacterized protein n=1 Tax=Streptomyces zagrosensis TaxID=1042984 RepID=A0A7W9Q9R2_9ACTN|nr:DUF6278 family protein [Streptomyces zagrosensis]MBB5936248.1 hypothetical protein [Streptomyces zagrosensis]
MNISFLDHWRKRHGAASEAKSPPTGLAREGLAELLSECELLRARAESEDVALDDTAASLAALDQLQPRWRDDPEESPWLGTDAGLYLGTVIVRTVSGAEWRLSPDGTPVVALDSGREIDVVAAGLAWAEDGAPELSQLYAEVDEG